ncbi:MFS transporter [Lactiplantibacillus pentosus]
MRQSAFRFLWLSFLISSIGDWLYKLALPVVILQKTGSAYHAATAFGVSFIPWIIFSMIGGVVADNYSKKHVLIFGNFIASGLALLLLSVLWQRQLNYPLMYIAIFLLASVDPLTHPGFQSIIPELVANDYLVAANATIQTIENCISVVGPLLGGAIITLIGGYTGLLVDVGSFLAAALLLCWLPSQRIAERGHSSILGDLQTGFAYTIKQRVILSGSLMFFFTNFALNMFEANYMYYMIKQLGYSLFETSIAMTIAGIGALLGGLLSTRLITNRKAGAVLTSSTMWAGGLTFLLLFSHNFIYIGLILASINAFGTLNVVTYFSLRQRTVPERLLGRVVAVTRMVSYAAIPLGSWVGGLILGYGYQMSVVIIAAGIIRFGAGFLSRYTAMGHEV